VWQHARCDIKDRQAINLRNVASGWLIYLKCMMMHGLANFKFITYFV